MSAPFEHPTAWVVEDSPTESEMARRALEKHYSVEVFLDSAAAVEQLAARRPPDVLVLDWMMPGLTGIDVCRFVRSQPATSGLAVLLLTANQATAQIVEGLEAGADDYVSKPYAPEELRARVDALVRAQRMRARAVRAESALRKVLSQMPDAVITVANDRRITFANARAASLFGMKDLQGRLLADLAPVLEEQLTSSPGPELRDVQIGERTLSPRVSIPPADDEGNTTVVLRDVTGQREREIRQVDFYSMVAHDLRSPINALQMRAQVLARGMRGPLPDEVKVEVERMIGRLQDLSQMVSDFLDIAQMESAQFKLERTEVDLAETCAQVYEEFRPLASARSIGFTLQAPESARVLGDARRLRQVVANIVSNALKFTQGGGTVAVRAAVDEANVELTVQDNGRGIPAEAIERLFKKYQRVAGSTAAKVEGTGLGLVIVKELVEAHGGSVAVRSQPGKGSTFTITLPRARAR